MPRAPGDLVLLARPPRGSTCPAEVLSRIPGVDHLPDLLSAAPLMVILGRAPPRGAAGLAARQASIAASSGEGPRMMWSVGQGSSAAEIFPRCGVALSCPCASPEHGKSRRFHSKISSWLL